MKTNAGSTRHVINNLHKNVDGNWRQGEHWERVYQPDQQAFRESAIRRLCNVSNLRTSTLETADWTQVHAHFAEIHEAQEAERAQRRFEAGQRVAAGADARRGAAYGEIVKGRAFMHRNFFGPGNLSQVCRVVQVDGERIRYQIIGAQPGQRSYHYCDTAFFFERILGEWRDDQPGRTMVRVVLEFELDTEAWATEYGTDPTIEAVEADFLSSWTAVEKPSDIIPAWSDDLVPRMTIS